MRGLNRDPRVIRTAVGLDVELGTKFDCVLTAHAIDGIAWVEVGEKGVAYACDCDGDHDAPKTTRRSLTDVYATRVAGTRWRGTTEFVLWQVRLAQEAGVLPYPLVLLPRLPTRGPAYMKQAYEGLRKLLAARALTHPNQEEFLFTGRFVSDWCGFGNIERAKTAIKFLTRHRIIVRTGDWIPCGKHQAIVYRVGDVPADESGTVHLEEAA